MAAKQSMASIVSTQDDLCNWEFVNRFDFDIEGGFDDDDDESIYDLVESIHSLSSSLSKVEDDDQQVKVEPTIDANADADGHVDDEDVECVGVSDLGGNQSQNDAFHEYYDGSNLNLHGHVHHVDDEDEDEEEEEEEDGHDIDDELVPWEVKDRFVRERIRKSGKNSFGRNAKTKKSALVFTRPGCVRGKHGLGLMVY